MTQIFTDHYKGIPGVVLESPALRATFLPAQGAKLCSLIEKDTGTEYIYQGKTCDYRVAKYAQSYLEGECAGVDEMFPNVDAFFYGAYPWEGTPLPDHGEVWSLAWDMREDGKALVFTTTGVRLPYRLTKRVSFADARRLRMEYSAKNLSDFPMDYIWAAHMMLRAERDCRFEFDEALVKAYTTISTSKRIGRYGDTFEYPVVKLEDGTTYDIRVHRGYEADDYQKFYFADRLREGQGWGGVRYPDGSRLKICFPVEEVPYLGAIQGEGGEFDLRCMFLEPCTGAFDRPDIARMHNMHSTLAPREEREWYLDILLEREI